MMGIVLIAQFYAFPDVPPALIIKDYNTKMDLTGITLNITLDVQNPYPFEIVLKGIDLNVKVGNYTLTKISTTSQTKIAASSSASITLSASATYDKALEAIDALLSSNKITLSLDGNMVFDLKVPNLQTETINIPINLELEF
jgi:LEA14-like dessication related protein